MWSGVGETLSPTIAAVATLLILFSTRLPDDRAAAAVLRRAPKRMRRRTFASREAEFCYEQHSATAQQ
jgi:ABC-type spermidine/putrescine transport system permease subunit II